MSAQLLPRPRRRSGLLLLMTVLLTGTAGLRMGLQSSAYALDSEVAAPTRPATVETCADPEDLAAAILSINQRQARLDADEARLANRMRALDVAETKLRENTDALVAAEKRLAATMALASAAADDDLTQLTAVYENMKPKNAANLFATMSPEFAAGFLGRMRADAAAAILSSLPPETAYAISLVLAGRNAGAPRE